MKLVSKKDIIFISCIFLFVIVFSLLTGGNAVEVQFDSEVVAITATGFEFNIAYTDVEKIEMSILPDLGTMDKGTDSSALKCGNWNNTIWGDYHLCVIPELEDCVVATLKDGRTVVFNYKDTDSTEGVYSIFQDYLDDVAAAA